MIQARNSSLVLFIFAMILACVMIVGWSNRSQAYSKVGWEYKIVNTSAVGPGTATPGLAFSDPERYFNELGAEGWELVQIVPGGGTGEAGGMRTGVWILKRAR